MCLKAYECYSIHPDFGTTIVVANNAADATILYAGVCQEKAGPHHVDRAPKLDKHALGRYKAAVLGSTP